MSRLAVKLRVPVESGWRQRDRLRVYGDGGSGVLDMDTPLMSKAVDMFPKDVRVAVAPPGHARVSHALAPHCGATPRVPHRAGWACYPHASVAHGRGYDFIEIDVQVPQSFGVHKFAAQSIDGAGNVQGDLVEFSHLISGEDPAPLTRFAFAGYDKPSDRLTFSFEE